MVPLFEDGKGIAFERDNRRLSTRRPIVSLSCGQLREHLAAPVGRVRRPGSFRIEFQFVLPNRHTYSSLSRYFEHRRRASGRGYQ
jgi:hypothetical protein